MQPLLNAYFMEPVAKICVGLEFSVARQFCILLFLNDRSYPELFFIAPNFLSF